MKEREAQAMANKRQSVEFWERPSLRQSAEVQEIEAQAMATKRQSAEFRKRGQGY